jgi:hypothetical protein
MAHDNEMFFEGLNQNQIDAIKSTEGYVRIIAGAGTPPSELMKPSEIYCTNSSDVFAASTVDVDALAQEALHLKQKE